MVYIYVLHLQSNKYYIGKTLRPKFRLDSHFNSNGSAWTKIYKPLKVLDLIPNCDDFDEDKWTLKYMAEKGIDNVRGGSFCKVKLSSTDVTTIQKMIIGTTDKCYRCNRKGHFANKCYAKTHCDGSIIHDSSCSDSDSYSYSEDEDEDKCNRCYREGHYENECYAKTYRSGRIIPDVGIMEIASDVFGAIRSWFSGK